MHNFFIDESGQTLVEYDLLVSLDRSVVIAVLSFLGQRVKTVFNAANNALSTDTN